MKSLIPVALCSLALFAAVNACAREAPKAQKHPTPELKVDDSPVGANRSPAPLVTYADVIEPVQKAVVSIYSSKVIRYENPVLRQFFPNLPERESRRQGMGSGVIVTADGYILTNNHVVEGADELEVSLPDDRKFTAKIIGTDPKTDVAVIKIDAANLPFVTLADSDKLRVGDVVFAVGNPLDVGQTVTMGIVSAKNRNVRILEEVGGYEDFIQTDAAINMGNSGGALIDARGRLVGINSAILSPSRGNIGIGFAIPINMAASIMRSLVETGTVARGYLGVSTETLTPDVAEQLGLPRDTRGVVISDIYPDSPAEKSGLQRADVMVSVNGRNISSVDEMRLLIAQMAPGTPAKIRVFRDGKERTITVTLDRFAERPNELFEGVDVRPLTREDRQRFRIDPRINGLLITSIADDSPYRGTLAEGAIIVEINRTPVREIEDARELLRPGRNLLAIYYRGTARFVVITLR